MQTYTRRDIDGRIDLKTTFVSKSVPTLQVCCNKASLGVGTDTCKTLQNNSTHPLDQLLILFKKEKQLTMDENKEDDQLTPKDIRDRAFEDDLYKLLYSNEEWHEKELDPYSLDVPYKRRFAETRFIHSPKKSRSASKKLRNAYKGKSISISEVEVARVVDGNFRLSNIFTTDKKSIVLAGKYELPVRVLQKLICESVTNDGSSRLRPCQGGDAFYVVFKISKKTLIDNCIKLP